MKPHVLAAGMVLAMHALSVSAQPHTTPTADALIITATRLDEQSATAASTTVISAEEIAKSPAQSLPELLAMQAGILHRSLFGNYGARDSVDLRGFGATAGQNTLILLDGRRLNDVDLAAVDFPAIPLSSVERIEITRSGGAVLYGDGAVGGTINIITKSPGRTGTHGSTGATVGSYDTRGVNADINHGSQFFGIRAIANYLESDGYRKNNRLEQTNVLADMRWTDTKQEWFIKLRGDDQELRLPGVRLVDPGAGIDELRTDRRGTSTPNDFADQSGSAITAGLTAFLPGRSLLTLDAGLRKKHQESLFQGLGFADTRLSTWSLTPRFVANHTPLGLSGRSIVGIDFYRSDYDSDRATTRDTLGTPIHRLSIDQDSFALYGQTTNSLTASTALVLGGRLQRVQLHGGDAFDPTAPGAAFESEAADLDQTRREPSYEIGVEQKLSDRLAIYARFERSVRFATVDELFEFDPTTFVRVFSPLEPQVARTFDVGGKYGAGDRNISINAYRMRLTNEIHFNPLTFTNDNLDPTRRYGIALSAEDRLTAHLRGKLDYAYTRAKFRDGPFQGNDVPLVPQHTAALALLCDLASTRTVSAVARYTGSKRFDNDQSNTFALIPSHTVVDLKYASTVGRFYWDVSINNVFNRAVFDYGVRSVSTAGRFNAFPLPERNYAFSVSHQF